MSSKYRISASIFMILLLAGAVESSAQLFSNPGSTIFQAGKPADDLKSMSLLDPDRFTMNHSYMMSYSSMGGSGNMVGAFITSMRYEFSTPLIMQMKVAHQISNNNLFNGHQFSQGPFQNQYGRVYIPSADIIYRPWKNTTISFHYRDFSGQVPYGYGHGGWGYPRYSPYRMY